ncbi:MAG: arsenic resistance protein [Thermomicrobiales bacterium]|nr:arsenic resistance protein [Thermomicrobiales bacterium]
MPRLTSLFRKYTHTFMLLGAILVGSLLGQSSARISSFADDWLDFTILALVTLLFAEVPFSRVRLSRQDRPVLIALWIANFAVIPFLGYGLARVFLHGHELAMIGLVIYFMSPCTDWFLSFTRLAKGNTALGMMFIPISMATQLALYPIYIWLFTPNQVSTQISQTGETIYGWFVIPVIIAAVIQLVGHYSPESVKKPLSRGISGLSMIAILLVVVCVFAANISTILEQANLVPYILAAVFTFFVCTWFLAEGISNRLHLSYENHALLSMSTAARNAPLMLAITMVAIPDQPVIYAALVVGMLLEFPHLTLLTQLLHRRHSRMVASSRVSKDDSQELGSETSTPGQIIW